jgi:hypothetical protein
MRSKYLKTSILLISILLLVLITPSSFAANYDRAYSSQVQFGLVNHELYVSVPSSLYDYYHGKTIKLAEDSDYAKLVTPDAVKPIAEALRNLTRDSPRSDEAFANAVLTLVHQIPYAVDDVKYPVETIVQNSGKCDTLSLLAASIMKAGGLDAVLFYFKDIHHINVGVYLPYQPHTTWWWTQPGGYQFNGKKYWIAECTPAMDWKVGDVPPLLANEQPCIISLNDSEESSPACVSSTLGGSLNASSISINLSSNPLDLSTQERTFTVTGSISPAYPNETVAVYISQDGISYNACETETDNWGNYSFNWNLTSTGTGTYYVRTSWSGNSECAGADSEILTVFLGFPQSLIQFKGPDYLYTYGRAYVASHELSIRQGVKDFLDVQLSGTGVLLTGEFIILKSGQIVTIPESGATRVDLEKIVIPQGLQPLRLPDDIEQTTNNQFGVILRNSGGNNYTLNVRGLDNYEMAKINPLGGNGIAFMNTSACIKENTWYKVEASVSADETTAKLYDVNGTLLENIATMNDAVNPSELVILIANNTGKAVAFKNLSIETLNQTTPIPQPPEVAKRAATGAELLAPYVTVALLLVTFFVAVACLKNGKKTQRPALKGKRIL